MGRRIDVGDIITPTEIAAIFGVTRGAVSNWAARRESTGFPMPLNENPNSPIYSRSDIKKWVISYKMAPLHAKLAYWEAIIEAIGPQQ